MAKRRKTREQKKVADFRHNVHHSPVSYTFEKNTKTPKIEPSRPTQTPTTLSAYPFLVKDLTKTFILTTIIMSAQVVIFFMLKNHTIVIPGLTY